MLSCRLIPEDQETKSKKTTAATDNPMPTASSSTPGSSEYDEMFTRLAPTVPIAMSAKKRSASLQRIRSICGADDARSNSFNLCSMLLEKKETAAV